jgi:hypothetical protein
MAISFFAILLVVLLVGLVIGSVVTGVVLLSVRTRAAESGEQLPPATDPSNPYAPSQVTYRSVGAGLGCAIAGVLLLIAGALSIAGIFWFTLVSAPKPATPQPPTPITAPPMTAPPAVAPPSPAGGAD